MDSSAIDQRVFIMDRKEIDAYPDGVITLGRDATIKRYNRAEAQLARRSQADTIGLNFFRDVAPCTAVQDFQGRFDAFAAKHDSGVERFDFTFRFAWGQQDVGITMIRKAGVDDINVLVTVRSKNVGPS
jgi:photoactive yellow protein